MNILILTIIALVLIATFVISRSKPEMPQIVYGNNQRQYKTEMKPFFDRIYKGKVFPPNIDFLPVPIYASNLQFFLYQLNSADKSQGCSQIMPIDKKDFFVDAIWNSEANDWILTFMPRFFRDEMTIERNGGAHYYESEILHPDYKPIIKY